MNGRKEYKDVIYIIDFGLSKRYKDPKTGQHVKFTFNRRLNGTAKFASVHALEGYENSRRDDLEGLCYVLIYFLKGELPWNKIKCRNKQERYKLILAMKKKMLPENLVGDKSNIEFMDFLKYCKKLDFEEKPDYDYLRGLMIKSMSKNNKYTDKFYNFDINENPKLISNDKSTLENISQTTSNQKTRSNTTQKIKATYTYCKIATKNKNSNNNKNNNLLDSIHYDKELNESRSGSIGYIDNRIKNYTNSKTQGIKDVQIKSKNIIDQTTNKSSINTIKEKEEIPKYNKVNLVHFKTYSRSRFNFIKKSFGITSDNNNQISKSNITFNQNNNNYNSNKNDSCIIM